MYVCVRVCKCVQITIDLDFTLSMAFTHDIYFRVCVLPGFICSGVLRFKHFKLATLYVIKFKESKIREKDML